MPPKTNSRPATTKNPQKYDWLGDREDVVGQPREAVQQEQQADDDEDPGGGADDDALEQLRDLLVTSALASSISSRTSSETRSEMSWTACATFWGEVSVAKATQDHGGEDAAGESRADGELGALGGEDLDLLRAGRRTARRRGRRRMARWRSVRRRRRRSGWRRAAGGSLQHRLLADRQRHGRRGRRDRQLDGRAVDGGLGSGLSSRRSFGRVFPVDAPPNQAGGARRRDRCDRAEPGQAGRTRRAA